MGNVSSDTVEDFSQYEQLSTEDVPEHIEKHGLTGIDKFFKEKLQQWKNVKITIGVTGDSGVGKSSFINAIRGLDDEHEGAAKTDVTQTTKKVAVYRHPTNRNITFCDLPGIGTPDYPAETYSEKVGLEKYDTFLILAASRFTENDLRLADKVKKMKKSFFFVRTKIDQDDQNERRKKAFNQEAMLKRIRKDCWENLKSFGADDTFLISNHHPAKWEFARLAQAILDVLPLRQRESLTLSLDLLTSLSKDILKRKVEILRARIWMVAATSAAFAAIPLPGLSIVVDFALIMQEVNLYKSQLRLPKEKSNEFQEMTKVNQETILKFCFTSMAALAQSVQGYGDRSQAKRYATSTAVEEFARYIPFIGSVIAGSISFGSTYYFLWQCLNELEKTAFNLLDETNTKVGKDMDIASVNWN